MFVTDSKSNTGNVPSFLRLMHEVHKFVVYNIIKLIILIHSCALKLIKDVGYLM